ncbi:MAG: arylsulfatase [Phycisphaerales bacterium]|nr:MAG: arylsulfatase [Phycisphaerales bacterium]
MTEQQPVNRRTFIGMLAAGAGASLLGADARGGQRKRPNIVVIIPDDLGWADIGYHGSDIRTPNLDSLARQSVRFERHYVMPTCTPTRVGFLTGHYPSRYGVLSPAYGKIFNDDTVTLARALRECGYTTAISGKWHMGSPPEYTPLKYGFDSSYGYFHGQIDPYTHYYKTGVRSWHRNDQYLDEKGHATDLITDEAVHIIESDHDKPFFLYVTYSVPHHPLAEPDEWTSKYEGRIEDPSRRLFAASVTHMDHGIGRIIDALASKGLRENTLVVFISDNGGQRSWHSDKEYKGRYADKPHTVLGNNEPLRGWKGEVYEGGIRVPALANWPGVLKPGTLTAPVHIVDWMPTLCGLAGYVPQRDLKWDGRDVWPSISRGTARAEPLLFYWKTPNASAVRHGDWKLIVPKKSKVPELYNVTSDPYEEHDMAKQQPDRVKDLKQRLAALSADDR